MHAQILSATQMSEKIDFRPFSLEIYTCCSVPLWRALRQIEGLASTCLAISTVVSMAIVNFPLSSFTIKAIAGLVLWNLITLIAITGKQSFLRKYIDVNFPQSFEAGGKVRNLTPLPPAKVAVFCQFTFRFFFHFVNPHLDSHLLPREGTTSSFL